MNSWMDLAMRVQSIAQAGMAIKHRKKTHRSSTVTSSAVLILIINRLCFRSHLRMREWLLFLKMKG